MSGGSIDHVGSCDGTITHISCAPPAVVEEFFWSHFAAGLDIYGNEIGAAFSGYYHYAGGSGDIPIKWGGGSGGGDGGGFGDGPPTQWDGGWSTGDIPIGYGGGYGSFGGGYNGDPPIEFDWGIE